MSTGLTPAEARSIAHDAYVFGYPVVYGYRLFWLMAMDDRTQAYGGLNQLTPSRRLAHPNFVNSEPQSNVDTLYTMNWWDLRHEPLVLSIPSFPDGRYHSVQVVDLYTHNIAFYGHRTTGDEACNVLVAGPGWNGTAPEGVDHVLQSESDLVYVIVRILVAGPHEVPSVHAMQDGYRLRPLSAFTGTPPPPALPEHHWQRCSAKVLTGTPDLFKAFNYFAQFIRPHPDDASRLRRFARIGVGAGLDFDLASMPSEFVEAICAGVQTAHGQIVARTKSIGRLINGWSVIDDIRGDRSRMAADDDALLRRAAAALYAIYGADPEEAIYYPGEHDAQGRPLRTDQDYTITFETPPPADAFWSVTMYSGPRQLLCPNPIDRYAIGDRDDYLRRDSDGGITIEITREPPPLQRLGNWLPRPAEPWIVVLRLYCPRPEVLDGRWRPPGITEMETT